jgi:hypothetical protein
MEAVRREGINKLFISHNANATEAEFMRRVLPNGTQFGCDPKRWSECGDDPSGWQRITTDQAICSRADIFLGSRYSSFTGSLATHTLVRVTVTGKLTSPSRPCAVW